MNQPCLKLTAYFGERQRAVGDSTRFLADAMLDLFGASDVATSVMLRAAMPDPTPTAASTAIQPTLSHSSRNARRISACRWGSTLTN